MNVNGHQFLTNKVTVSEIPTIPSGTYDATLEGVTEEEHEQYGDRWVWHWTIPEVHPDGEPFELQVWTPPRLSSKGMASEQAKALGASVAKGSEVALGDLRGRRARLVVMLDEEKGRNRVKGVLPFEEPTGSSTSTVVDPDYEAWKAAQAVKQNAPEASNVQLPLPVSAPPSQAA